MLFDEIHPGTLLLITRRCWIGTASLFIPDMKYNTLFASSSPQHGDVGANTLALCIGKCAGKKAIVVQMSCGGIFGIYIYDCDLMCKLCDE